MGSPLEDVQAQGDQRGIALERVGVSGLRYPIIVLDRENAQQQTIARVSMSVSLPHHFKGTHMSRFVEVLNEFRGEITLRTMPKLLTALRAQLDAESAHAEFAFPYFLERSAPVSGARALMDYSCRFVGEANGGTETFILDVRVPVTSLCPCSKAISDYGAHNQRGEVQVRTESRKGRDGTPAIIWIEELVAIAEQAGSAPVYPLLKRADERHVTMQAFDNPAFVEDIVRAAATKLMADPRVEWFEVSATNQESIHNHDVFATTSWRRGPEASL